MELTRKKQTLGLLEKLRTSGKPTGRSDDVEAGPETERGPGEDMPPPGVDPADWDLMSPEEKKKRLEEFENEPADVPTPVTSSY